MARREQKPDWNGKSNSAQPHQIDGFTVPFEWEGRQQLPPVPLLHMEDCFRITAQAIQTHDILEVHCLSLKDMVSMQRLQFPCRSLFCTHLQCFDYITLLETNKHKSFEDFACPMCSQPANPFKIYLDSFWLKVIHYMEDKPKEDSFYLTKDGKFCWGRNISICQSKLVSTKSIRMVIVLDEDDEIGSNLDTGVDQVQDIKILDFKNYPLPAQVKCGVTKICSMAKWNIFDILYVINHEKRHELMEMLSVDEHLISKLVECRPFVCSDLYTLVFDLIVKLRISKHVGNDIALRVVNFVKGKITSVFKEIPNNYKSYLGVGSDAKSILNQKVSQYVVRPGKQIPNNGSSAKPIINREVSPQSNGIEWIDVVGPDKQIPNNDKSCLGVGSDAKSILNREVSQSNEVELVDVRSGDEVTFEVTLLSSNELNAFGLIPLGIPNERNVGDCSIQNSSLKRTVEHSGIADVHHVPKLSRNTSHRKCQLESIDDTAQNISNTVLDVQSMQTTLVSSKVLCEDSSIVLPNEKTSCNGNLEVTNVLSTVTDRSISKYHSKDDQSCQNEIEVPGTPSVETFTNDDIVPNRMYKKLLFPSQILKAQYAISAKYPHNPTKPMSQKSCYAAKSNQPTTNKITGDGCQTTLTVSELLVNQFSGFM